MYKRRNNRGERRSGIGSSFISGGEVVCVQKEATQSNRNRNSNTGGSEAGDDKHVVISGGHARWTERGIEHEADSKHRKLIMDHFSFGEDSSYLAFEWREGLENTKQSGRKRFWSQTMQRFFVELQIVLIL